MENIWILVSRNLNSRIDERSKDFGLGQNIEETCICMKLSGSYGSIILALYVTDIFEQEPCGYYPELNMCLTYLSGSHVDVILVLYVTDIFEWEKYECYPRT